MAAAEEAELIFDASVSLERSSDLADLDVSTTNAPLSSFVSKTTPTSSSNTRSYSNATFEVEPGKLAFILSRNKSITQVSLSQRNLSRESIRPLLKVIRETSGILSLDLSNNPDLGDSGLAMLFDDKYYARRHDSEYTVRGIEDKNTPMFVFLGKYPQFFRKKYFYLLFNIVFHSASASASASTPALLSHLG